MTHPLLLIAVPAGSELLIILALIIWIAAIIDVVKSRFDSSTTKTIWLLVVIFAGILGAIIYYIAGRQFKIKAS
jgi:hypothetical protein